MTLLDTIATLDPEIDTTTEELCCVYAHAVLERWADLPPAAGSLLAAWRVWDVTDPWSPPRAAVLAGVGVPVDVPTVGRWHLVQGWRRGPDVDEDGKLDVGASGHTFLWRASSPTHGLQADSVASRGPAITARTWAAVLAEFRVGVRLAVLRAPRAG